MLEIEKFQRVPFVVDAVQVTAANLREVAKWCDGIVNADDRSKNFIKCEVIKPLHERQTKAYVGDWVLKTATGFKIYTAKAFGDGFVPYKNYDLEVMENSL